MTEKILKELKNEKVLYDKSPARRRFLSRLVEIIIYSLPFLVIWCVLTRKNVGLVLFGIGIVIVFYSTITYLGYLLRKNTHYVVTENRVFVERGIANTVMNQINIKDIMFFKVTYTLGDLIVKKTTATIKLYSKKKTPKGEKIIYNKDLSIYGIKEYAAISKLLEKKGIKQKLVRKEC